MYEDLNSRSHNTCYCTPVHAPSVLSLYIHLNEASIQCPVVASKASCAGTWRSFPLFAGVIDVGCLLTPDGLTQKKNCIFAVHGIHKVLCIDVNTNNKGLRTHCNAYLKLWGLPLAITADEHEMQLPLFSQKGEMLFIQ